MSAIRFVDSLFETGVARVATLAEQPADFGEAVRELDRVARLEMAFDPPMLVESAAVWGLQVLYRGCQFLIYRQVEAVAVQESLAVPCPDQPSPPICYSVDLALRYIPDLMALAHGIAPADPLVASLTALAQAWPLSSVGMTGLGDLDLSGFIDDRSLLQLYVDRIIQREDSSRLQNPAVRQAAAAAIGGFLELAPFLGENSLARREITTPR